MRGASEGGRTTRVYLAAVALVLATALLGLRCASFSADAAAPAVEGGTMTADAAADAADGAVTSDGAPTLNCPPQFQIGGQCISYDMATGVPGAWYVAVSTEYVYWTSNPDFGGDGAVRRVAKRGGPVEVVAPVGSVAWDLVVDDQTLVFSAKNSGVFKVTLPPAGTTAFPPPVTLWSSGTALDVLRHGSSVFFAASASGQGRVVEVNAAGIATIRASEATPTSEGIAADDQNIYWSNHVGGTIGRLTLDGGSFDSAWVSGQTSPRRVAVGADAVYWTSDTGNTVMKASKTLDQPPVSILDANIGYGTAVVDGNMVYVTLDNDGRFVRVDGTPGSTPVPIAENLQAPTGLAQDATAFYVAERGGGRIRRYFK